VFLWIALWGTVHTSPAFVHGGLAARGRGRVVSTRAGGLSPGLLCGGERPLHTVPTMMTMTVRNSTSRLLSVPAVPAVED